MSHRLLLSLLTVAALSVSGCGSDDDAEPSAPATPPPAAASGSTDDDALTGDEPAVPDDAAPVDPTAAITLSGKIKITAKDMKFSPSAITTKPGDLKVTLVNNGSMVHELVVLRTSQLSPDLKVTGKQVSEKNSIGSIKNVKPGKSASKTFDLKAGHYVIVCNVPGHYSAGMRGDIVVDGS